MNLMRRKIQPKNPEARSAVSNLLVSRKDRGSRAMVFAGIGAGTSAVGALTAELEMHSPIGKGLLRAAATSAIAAGAGFAAGYAHGNAEVRKATVSVGQILRKEARTNTELRGLFESHKYVYVDGKGNIAGTNMPRILLAGRLRLKSSDILEGARSKSTRFRV